MRSRVKHLSYTQPIPCLMSHLFLGLYQCLYKFEDTYTRACVCVWVYNFMILVKSTNILKYYCFRYYLGLYTIQTSSYMGKLPLYQCNIRVLLIPIIGEYVNIIFNCDTNQVLTFDCYYDFDVG